MHREIAMTPVAHPATWLSGHMASQLFGGDRDVRLLRSSWTAPPAEEAALVTAHFRPLDPEIVSETIPAFFIGRNKNGFWVARDVKGRAGGIFLLEKSAVSFARKCSLPAGCVTIFPSEMIELDLENRGNQLVGHLGSMTRLAKHLWRKMSVLISNFMAAVKRRLNNFHFSLD